MFFFFVDLTYSPNFLFTQENLPSVAHLIPYSFCLAHSLYPSSLNFRTSLALLIEPLALVEALLLGFNACSMPYFSKVLNNFLLSCAPSPQPFLIFAPFLISCFICLPKISGSLSPLSNTSMSRIFFFSTSTVITAFIQPLLTCHFCLIHSPLLLTFTPEPSLPTYIGLSKSISGRLSSKAFILRQAFE